jgi:hypothetical protein
MVLPVARTNAEAHLYMDLHPCACGEIRFPRTSSVVTTPDGVLASRYAGTCPQDGAEREFLFRVPERIPAPPQDGVVVYGGPEPSELIDPGEWLSVADAHARSVPADTAALAADGGAAARAAARAMLVHAVAAVEEVLKFIPAGADRVPEEAFVTDRGRAAYNREPGRFRRPRLEAARDTYRSIAAQL